MRCISLLAVVLSMASLCSAQSNPLVYSSDVGAEAITDGSVSLTFTLVNQAGQTYGAKHYAVAWITTASNTYIEAIWKATTRNAPDLKTWQAVNGGDTYIDGTTDATPSTFTPHTVTWDLRDKNNVLLPDGDYRFHVEYTQSDNQGPLTPDAYLQFTKGPNGVTLNPANLTNFKNMQIVYTPTPEPLTLSVLAIGATTMLLRRRRKA